ncbi:hypothetical protein AB0756_01685 [Tolypothrix campylonemoides VB511288_2]|uniref:Uncharacterized protein n=4 Tax=Cyanophyceae TaxID=3028117 RepID=A0A0C1R489_9CYAN|nr:hypothetical protein [Tolypothrix bouteillei]KAF3891320.1 hypothetical protein DA73_0400036290 [Tolypothrix bouteillei VB521301]
MDYQKLDTALTMRLNEVEDPQQQSLKVFIHTNAAADTADASDMLKNLGVADVTPGKDVFTADLSPNAISDLSEQPWVQYIKLSQNLNLLNQKTSRGIRLA